MLFLLLLLLQHSSGVFFNQETEKLAPGNKAANKVLQQLTNRVSLLHSCPSGCNAASEGFRFTVALAAPVGGSNPQLKASCSCAPVDPGAAIAAAVRGPKGGVALSPWRTAKKGTFLQVVSFLVAGLKESGVGAACALGLSMLVNEHMKDRDILKGTQMLVCFV